MNAIASIATVATDPCASRDATMPAAMSICERTQPTKIWPLALMSPGPGTTRRIGSRLVSLVVIPVSAIGFVVMAGTVADEEQPHQPGAAQHGEADAGHGGDRDLDRPRLAGALQIDKREKDGDDREQKHPAHDR